MPPRGEEVDGLASQPERENVAARAAGTLGRFGRGLSLLRDAAGMLRRERSLWPLALVPVLFAFGVLGVAISLFVSHLGEIRLFFSGLLPVLEAGAWWTWLWIGPGKLLLWLLEWLAVVAAFAVTGVVSLLLANLLSAPFLDQLSQRVELIARGHPSPGAVGLSAILAETARSFLAELQRLAFFGGMWLTLSLVGFLLPGAHLVTGPLLIALTILLLPLDYAGYALDRREVPFRERRRWLWRNRPTMLGFGGVAFLACLVPGLNLVVLPTFVTAGTLLVVRIEPGVATAPGDGSSRVV